MDQGRALSQSPKSEIRGPRENPKSEFRQSGCVNANLPVSWGMAAKQTFSYILSDDQMRSHLQNGNTLLFEGLADDWEAVERQIERLGFGDTYLVSLVKGRGGDLTKVMPVRK